jgi:4-hydroxy-tetrahydrodipicolinate reductase
MIHVIVCGVAGRMGGRLANLVVEASDLDLVGGTERPGHEAVGKDIGTVIGKPPMGIAALAHAYELMNGTAIDIDGGLGRSSSALMELDEVEIWMVYRGLRQELSNAESAQHVR